MDVQGPRYKTSSQLSAAGSWRRGAAFRWQTVHLEVATRLLMHQEHKHSHTAPGGRRM